MSMQNKQLKRRIIEISYKNKLSHIGSCLEAVDIIKDIYDNLMGKDRFVLSQGHAGLALYVVLEALRCGDAERMWEDMGTHPTRKTMVDWLIECSTGSLGHGLPIALGMALADRDAQIHCLISDGEMSEGSIDETFRIMNNLSVNNLSIYINHNGYGAYSKLDNFQIPLKERYDKTIRVFDTNVDYLPFLEGLEGHYHVMTEQDYGHAMEKLK